MNKETGGHAFPAMHFDLTEHEHGMTLRDYFAANATEGDIQHYIDDYSEMVDSVYYSFGSSKAETTKLPKKRTREQAKYIYADAMLKARTE